MEDTRTPRNEKERNGKNDDPRIRKEPIHTADNERATWVTLLSALQYMEKRSRAWEQAEYKRSPPRKRQASHTDYILAVAVQYKITSWDTMPANLKRPYATTTICHLIEMVALLGLHWKEFNRSNDRYRAEGNGYMMGGSIVNDLGIMFNFKVCGKTRFEENRVIPVNEVKELCFGFVPTIFSNSKDDRRLDFPGDQPQDLSTLQLASNNDVAETLVVIGCNMDTVDYFRKLDKKHEHLFPGMLHLLAMILSLLKTALTSSGFYVVSFEILGMLCRTLHIENSSFRMLPNPTSDRWEKKSFSLQKLLRTYLKYLRQAEQINLLESLVNPIETALRGNAEN